jgi:hypothetical protein
MKILFVLNKRVDAGSIHAVANYIRAGDEAGHLVALYGHPDPHYPAIRFCSDPGAFDYVVFIAETSVHLSGLRFAHILGSVRRSQRAIVDTDGMFSPLTVLDNYDRNHRNGQERAEWLERHRPIADRILQPTLAHAEEHINAVSFFGYDPVLPLDLQGPSKRYDIVYVGHNWWRWREMSSLILPGIEQVRDRVGDICFIGSWWDSSPPWARYLSLEEAFQVDCERLDKLRIQVRPAVPYSNVVKTMAQGRINIMLQRPVLRHLRILTAKYFEVFSADTIPLLALNADHAKSVYGSVSEELLLGPVASDKIVDVITNESRYLEIVHEVRKYLETHHSYRKRLQELIDVLKGKVVKEAHHLSS